MEAEYQNIANMIVRVRTPTNPGPYALFILLHGLTGDENSMWVFADRLPKQALLIAPRGLYPVSPKGYSWHLPIKSGWPTLIDFEAAFTSLSELLLPHNFPEADFSQINAVGFSQGAALALSFMLTHPDFVCATASLSGFLPDGTKELAANHPLLDNHVFLAHGTLDNQVPIARGREAVDIMELAGASVTYCEDEVGHKLSASCFRGLEAFFKKVVNC